MAAACAGRVRSVHTLGEAYCNLIMASTHAGEWELAAEWCATAPRRGPSRGRRRAARTRAGRRQHRAAGRCRRGACRRPGPHAELFATARRRAEQYRVAVEWVEGDAEDLPFGNESFDAVLSAFGVQFAPRHAVAARELARVCRPGGTIGVVKWTPEGQVGEVLRTIGRHMPAPPACASSPPLWGSEQHVLDLFADTGVRFEFARGLNPLGV